MDAQGEAKSIIEQIDDLLHDYPITTENKAAWTMLVAEIQSKLLVVKSQIEEVN